MITEKRLVFWYLVSGLESVLLVGLRGVSFYPEQYNRKPHISEGVSVSPLVGCSVAKSFLLNAINEQALLINYEPKRMKSHLINRAFCPIR